MELEEYLISRKFTRIEFSKMVGVTVGGLGKYIRGERMPTLQIARAIENASNGKVTIDDLIETWRKKNEKLD